MQEIVPGIHTWSWFFEEKGLDFNGFYVRGPEGAVIVDPPQYSENDLGQMDRLGTPQAIMITNGHHLRRARDLATHFGVPIRIHEADAPMIDPEWLKLESLNMVLDAKVELLLHSWVAAPLVEDGKAVGAILENNRHGPFTLPCVGEDDVAGDRGRIVAGLGSGSAVAATSGKDSDQGPAQA